MPRSRLIVFSTCLGTLFSLANCSAPTSSTGEGGASGSSAGSAGSTGSGGDAAGAAGTTGSGGNASGSSGTTGSGGSVSSKGGTTGSAGNGSGGNTSGSAGSSGSTGAGGTVSSRGGTNGTAGSSGAAGSSGTTGRGGSSGSTGTAGSSGSTGAGGTGPVADACGVAIAKAGDSTSSGTNGTVNGIAHCTGYLNLGDMRLINNRWGSDALGCTATQESVMVNSDRTFGWNFNRPTCGGKRADPDFPEVEFGVAPFGTGSSSLTSPPFSSTTLLPIQISALNSASLTFSNFTTSITTNQTTSYWDHNFEFWISKLDPTKNANAQVYAEIIIFLGWEPNRQNGNANPPGWSCSVPTAVTTGNFTLCHQSDSWGSGWRFFNFVDSTNSSGALPSYNQKVDIKAILTSIVAKYSGFTSDMWLTRIEVGTEVDDTTAGSVKMNNLTFEINGVSKSAQIQ